MKKLISIILIVAVLAALCLPVSAAQTSASEAIDTLERLGLVKGTGNGFAPERGATRAEALTMLLRLLGQEAEAKAETAPCPFYDGGWAAPYLTYAWKHGLAQGRSSTYFGSNDPVSVRDYLTMVLRALGYSDAAGDFSWSRSIAFSDGVGLTHGEYPADGSLLREDLALISYTALTLPVKGTGQKLIERLYLSVAVSADALKQTRLAWALDAGQREYTPAEIHALGASAVVYVELYETEEELEKDKPSAHGSGFFVTGDGVALLSYHELDGCTHVRVTTLDGKRYDVTGVLAYDPLWDMAAVRVSRQATDGSSVRFFPHLDLGDSDAVYPGARIYALGNPLGLVDSISEGIISNRARDVNDPAYPCLEFTAPIAPGSSGGPLLNSHGRVVGIIQAMFVNGQVLNLATPVNCVPGESLSGEGTPLTAVKEAEDAKKAAAEISATKTQLHLECGQSVELMISHTWPGTANLQYKILQSGVVDCDWGHFVSKHSVPLTVTAVGTGEADIEIRFTSEHESEALLTIHVTVSEQIGQSPQK